MEIEHRKKMLRKKNFGLEFEQISPKKFKIIKK